MFKVDHLFCFLLLTVFELLNITSSASDLQRHQLQQQHRPLRSPAGQRSSVNLLSTVPPPPRQSISPQQSDYYRRGYYKLITLPDKTQRYVHAYNIDDNGHYESHTWEDPNQAASVRSVYEYQKNRADHAQRSSPQNRPMSLVSPLAQPHSSRNPPVALSPMNPYSYNNQPSQYQRSYPQDNRRRRIDNNANEISSPMILKQSPLPPWLNNMEQLVNFIKSPSFLDRINSLGTQNLFKSKIVGQNVEKDEVIIKSNIEKTGLNFTNAQDDCKPKVTTIKFGLADQPEIVYNPSSVEVLRCSQGCFSWQFDCIPTSKVTYNFTVSVYKINGDKINREVNDFSIESHKSCACSCQSLAGCFGSTEFSSQRLPPRSDQF